MTETVEQVERDFAYAGKRLLTDGKTLGVKVVIVDADGQLGDSMLFKYSKGLEKSLGYIYSGAKFHEGGAIGIDTSKNTGRRVDQTTLLGWKTQESDALAKRRTATMEAELRKTDDVEEIMLPLRKLYERYRRRYDRDSCRALDHLVLQALHTSPRASEGRD